MTAAELTAVKQYQRDFEEKFDRKLLIDWAGMNGVVFNSVTEAIDSVKEEHNIDVGSGDIQDIFDGCVKKHRASKTKILNRKNRLFLNSSLKERNALKEFCQIVIKYKLSTIQAGKIINRNRTCVYHLGGFKYDRQKKMQGMPQQL